MASALSREARDSEIAPPPTLRAAILSSTIYRSSLTDRAFSAVSRFRLPAYARSLAAAGAAAALVGMIWTEQSGVGAFSPTGHAISHVVSPAAAGPVSAAPSAPGVATASATPRIESASPPGERRAPVPKTQVAIVPRSPALYTLQRPGEPAAGRMRRITHQQDQPLGIPPTLDTEITHLPPDSQATPILVAGALPREPDAGPASRPEPPVASGAPAPEVEPSRLTLVASNSPMSPDSMSTLAGIRRSLRQNIDAARASTDLNDMGHSREVTLAVYKTRF